MDFDTHARIATVARELTSLHQNPYSAYGLIQRAAALRIDIYHAPRQRTNTRICGSVLGYLIARIRDRLMQVIAGRIADRWEWWTAIELVPAEHDNRIRPPHGRSDRPLRLGFRDIGQRRRRADPCRPDAVREANATAHRTDW